MSRPSMEALSHHAQVRANHRNVPDFVIELFQQGKTFIAQGRSDNDTVTNYHIVRVENNEYLVGVERENVAVTFIRVTTPYGWFKNRIYNFKHMYEQIKRLPIAHPKHVKNWQSIKENRKKNKRVKSKKEIYRELSALWLDN